MTTTRKNFAMTDNKIITVNHAGLFIYVIYTLWIVGIEWINFLCKALLKADLQFGLAESIALVLIATPLFLWRKYLHFEKVIFRGELLIGTIIILVVGIAFSVYPDNGFDTFNYHLIAQNPQFENYFVEDFGYGYFQVWGFRLCDRMFYYFRILLGYRLGTILNVIALILSFSQVYFLFENIDRNITKLNSKKNVVSNIFCNKMIWALCVVFSLDAIMMLGSYYVDVVMMPIGIYVFRQVFEKADKNITSREIYIFALLCGLWIGGKLTNIVFVFPCVIIYVLLHFSQFKIQDWIVSIFLGLFSYTEYLIWNFTCTGNPFFPYYNAIFKSPYFQYSNFKDTRWGGETIFEKFFWILFAALKPEYRQSEIYDTHTSMLILGIVSLIIILISILIFQLRLQAINKALVSLVSIAILATLFWSFTTGYSRYFIWGRVIYGVCAFVVANKLCNVNIGNRFNTYIVAASSFFVGALSIVVFVNMCLTFIYSWIQGGWGWAQRNQKTLALQLQNVISDREFDIDKDIDMFVLTSNTTQGVAELIDSEAYAFGTFYIPNAEKDGYELLHDKLEEYSVGYDIRQRNMYDIKAYIETLNQDDLYLMDIVSTSFPIGEYELITLKDAVGEKNTVWTSKNTNTSIDVSGISGNVKISFIAGFAYDWDVPAVEIIFKDGNEILSSVAIDSKKIEKYESEIVIPEDIDELLIEARYIDSGEILSEEEQDFCFVVNTEVSKN